MKITYHKLINGKWIKEIRKYKTATETKIIDLMTKVFVDEKVFKNVGSQEYKFIKAGRK